ncbi:hypothetical protein ABIC30_006077 [Methylobacterium sp. 1030]
MSRAITGEDAIAALQNKTPAPSRSAEILLESTYQAVLAPGIAMQPTVQYVAHPGGGIRAILTDSPFHGEGHRKVWARLRMKGVRTSKRRVLRLMRAYDLLIGKECDKSRARQRAAIENRPVRTYGADLKAALRQIDCEHADRRHR